MSTVPTSCGVLVLSKNGQILLGHATGGRHWDIFKGLQESGESPRETALRELREESGLEPEPSSLADLGRFDYLPRKTLHLFALMIEPSTTLRLACTSTFVDRRGRSVPELDAFEWVPFEKVPERCGKNMALVLTSRISLPQIAEQLASGWGAGATSRDAVAVPARIQLSRAKGWRMPAHTVNVARPGRWGNPFPIGKPGPSGAVASDQTSSVSLFEAMLADPELRAAAPYPTDLAPLIGKNLACWCRPGLPCHADTLLKLANRPPAPADRLR